MRTWIDPIDLPVSAELLQIAGGQPLVAQVLARRGYADPAAARAFLDPACYTPAAPVELPGLQQAVLRLQSALRQGEHILVWGDFDVDGQTATAVLVSALRELGGRVSYHIPVRAQESHGVSPQVLKGYLEADDPPALVLTCDTGIAAHPAVDLANQRQVDVIITDHHELPPPAGEGEASQLPAACAVVTPRLLPARHPLSSLPGVGVAYKLAEALFEAAGRAGAAQAYQDLAALGIVADVALLEGEARYLLQRGLELLRQPQRVGLQAIYERAGLKPEGLTEEQIGFALAPRLNALGRLGDANPAVELLTTQDRGRARLLALELEGLNGRRQLLTSQVLRAALAQIEQEPALKDSPALVLAHPAWEAGVIGIVASRLVELFAKPVALIAVPGGELGRGSARSLPGVDITAAIAAQADLLQGFGGHVMAAGFSLPAENIPAFRRGLSRAVEAQLAALPDGQAVLLSALQIDAYLPWGDLNLELAEALERLAPFGAGNPALALVSRALHLVHQAPIGRQGEHLRLTLQDEQGNSQQVMWWGAGDYTASGGLPQGVFDLAYTLRPTTYRGPRELQIAWLEVRPVSQPVDLAPAAPSLERLDFRNQARPLPALQRLLAEAEPGALQVWAEGEALPRLTQALGDVVFSRERLSACQTLVIWSAPPGRAELLQALERAQPQRAALFGLPPGEDQPQAFLQRLAGLVKHALSAHAGAVDLETLAAACAQRALLVQLGLEWLAAMGHITLLESQEPPDEQAEARLQIRPGGEAQPALASELLKEIGWLLEETRAYRAYFLRGDPLE